MANINPFIDIPPWTSYNISMDDIKSLIDLENPKTVTEFLQAPASKVAQFLTGFFSSAPTQWIKSAGHLVQGWISCNFFEQFGRELKDYVEKGKVKKDFFSTGAQQASLRELLKFIDDGTDEERFNAMKSIFFASISVDATADEEVLGYELMQICKKLESNDILILKAIYDITKGGGSNIQGINLMTRQAADWLKIVAHKIGHKIPSLVEVNERRLIDLKLIDDRIYDTGRHTSSEIAGGPNFRLTQLGIKLCEFITKY